MNRVLPHSSKNVFWVWARMMIPVMVASAFVNNTRKCKVLCRATISLYITGLALILRPKLVCVCLNAYACAHVYKCVCTLAGAHHEHEQVYTVCTTHT